MCDIVVGNTVVSRCEGRSICNTLYMGGRLVKREVDTSINLYLGRSKFRDVLRCIWVVG